MPLIGAIVYALAALFYLANIISVLRYAPFLWILRWLIRVGGCGFLGFALFTKRRDIFLPVGFGVLALFYLLILRSFSSFLFLLGYLAMAFVCVVVLTDYLPQFRAYVKKLWFVPAAVIAFASLFSLFPFSGLNFLATVMMVAGAFLSSLWVVYPEGLPTQAPVSGSYTNHTGFASTGDSVSCSSGNAPSQAAPEMFYNLVTHILLLLFTCGVWQYIWIYRVTGYTNQAPGEEKRDPTTKLLLCLFVPFYGIYWTYKTAQRIDKMAASRGIASDLSTLCLILSFVIPIIPPILMQDKLNAIATASGSQPNTSPENKYAPQPQYKAPESSDTVEELKKYKELLDCGILTQEEFDAKKKQLLGL